MHTIHDQAWPFLITLGAAVLIYIVYVRPRIRQYRAIAGVGAPLSFRAALYEAAMSPWRRFFANLLTSFSGYKTVIFGFLSALTTQLPPMLDIMRGFTGWHVFLGQPTADKIAAGLALATAVTHVMGLVSAAEAVPVDARHRDGA